MEDRNVAVIGTRIDPEWTHSLSEQRIIDIGLCRGVFMGFYLCSPGIRPISARYMHAREIAHHEAALGFGDDDR